MTIDKIYLDMDGVLTDFEKSFRDNYGQDALAHRDRKLWTENWPDFILNKRGFESLPEFAGWNTLLEFIRQYKVEVEILTSSGGEKYHREVAEQKTNWLKNHGITYKPNVVPGRKHKKDYATPSTILIDDTEDVIIAFNKAGGIGIHHKEVGKTIEKLKELLDTDTK
jgi:hypothetical protein